MCGIVGVVGRPVSDHEMESALNRLEHRGPDARGSTSGPTFSLGHTRLAILDLDPRSNQPFSSPDGRYQLVFNGEIYNYIELREELEDGGHWHFSTSGDTEVVLASLVVWGPAAFRRFNGMWALAFFDTKVESVVLSRDRLGVKPLNYSTMDQSILFSSEIRALKALLPNKPQPNLGHLARFVVSSASQFSDATYYEDIIELLPAHYLTWQSGQSTLQRYWSPPHPDPSSHLETCQVRELLYDAVRLRLRSDVPVGITLSGGVDSSLVAAIAADLGFRPATYTAQMVGHPDDESKRAQKLASALGLDWHAIPVPRYELPLAEIRDITVEMDGPNAAPAALANKAIMRQMRASGSTVALEGQGADEVFGGYSVGMTPYVLRDYVRQGRLSVAAKHLRRMAALEGWPRMSLSLVRRGVPGAHTAYQRLLGTYGVLSGSLKQSVVLGEANVPQAYMSTAEALESNLVEGLRPMLHYGDRMSMSQAVEARQPFLDFRLVDLVYGSSIEARFANPQGKTHLREIARDILPAQDALVGRKLGFPMPLREWMLDARVESTLMNGHLLKAGFLNRSALSRMFHWHRSRDRITFTQSIYRLFVAELWWESEQW